MKFPTTREYLKKCVQKDLIIEKEKEQRYDFYRIIIQSICNDVEKMMLNSSVHDTYYIWKKLGIIGNSKILLTCKDKNNVIAHYDRMGHNNENNLKDENLLKYLPEFIELLKENFIGCDIIIDPLKTYIIIDWS